MGWRWRLCAAVVLLAGVAHAKHVGSGECVRPPAHLSPRDACKLVKHTCADAENAAHLVLYYCAGQSHKQVASVLHALLVFGFFAWLSVLFSALGFVAGDFFSPNLSLLSARLGLSDSTIGVTLLAMGNSMPDVLSTFQAMQRGAGALALGELMGASVFLVCVVCGSLMLLEPFEVHAPAFLRDAGTFAVAVSLTLFFLRDENLSLRDSVAMMMVYVVFVLLVVMTTRDDEEEAPPMVHNEALLPAQNEPLLSTPSEQSVSPSVLPLAVRHSILAAVEFRDLANEVLAGGGTDATAPLLSPSLPQHQPPLGRNLLVRSRSEGPFGYGALERGTFRRPGRRQSSENITAPVPEHTVPAARPAQVPPPVVPGSRETEPPAAPTEPPSTPPRPPALRIDTGTPQSTGSAATSAPRAPPSLPRAVQLALFPSLVHWSSKSWLNKMVSVTSVPALLALRATVPAAEDEPLATHEAVAAHEARHRLQLAEDGEAADQEALLAEDRTAAEGAAAQRVLVLVHYTLTVPFALWVLELPHDARWRQVAMALAAVVGSVIGAVRVRRERPPRSAGTSIVRSLVGFGVSLLWIVTAVDEIVNVLRTLGFVYGWSDAILGLSVFAIGNSLGDVVTNLSIARMGHPLMALSACFASPLSSLLLGVGVSSVGLQLARGTTGGYHIPLDPTLLVSGGALLSALLVVLVGVAWNGFRVSRALGMVLLSMYPVVMVGNLVLELGGFVAHPP